MKLSEFTDDYIAKTVASASRSYCQSAPWFADDARQIGFLALLELRQRLADRYRGCHELASRNIYYTVKRAIGRALAGELKHHGETDFELPGAEVGGVDFTERLFLRDRWQRLTTNEKRVLRQYYFLGMTQQQIATKRNVSRSRVGKIIQGAIAKMGDTGEQTDFGD